METVAVVGSYAVATAVGISSWIKLSIQGDPLARLHYKRTKILRITASGIYWQEADDSEELNFDHGTAMIEGIATIAEGVSILSKGLKSIGSAFKEKAKPSNPSPSPNQVDEIAGSETLDDGIRKGDQPFVAANGKIANHI